MSSLFQISRFSPGELRQSFENDGKRYLADIQIQVSDVEVFVGAKVYFAEKMEDVWKKEHGERSKKKKQLIVGATVALGYAGTTLLLCSPLGPVLAMTAVAAEVVVTGGILLTAALTAALAGLGIDRMTSDNKKPVLRDPTELE